jgi:uncharacterized protein with von Willebrand factor type A (vWA) domain
MIAEEESLATRMVEFCRFARDSGLSAGVKESVDALDAARAVGVGDREILKSAVRSVLCSSKDEWEQFDELFEAYWGVAQPGSRIRAVPRTRRQPDRRLPHGTITSLMARSAARETQDDGGKAVLGATAEERLKRTDFSQASQDDLPELERISIRLLRLMSRRLSRRLKSMRQRRQVDLRRTIRRNISRGDLIDLSYKARKIQQDRLVVLLDISGSMNPYSLFFLRFAYALERHFKRVDTFLFSTQLTEITASLRGRSPAQAMQSLARQAAGWSGGTKIGGSLKEFVMYHGARALSRDTVFIVLSDGWDTGPPGALAEELHAIRRRVRSVIWLNPLLGLPEYKPVTQGMSAALPYIDVFAPAHNLESLLALERVFRRR